MYMGAAMIKADQKATEQFEQLKLINLARLIMENEFLLKREEIFQNVHYVIHSDVKKEKIRSAYTILNENQMLKFNSKEEEVENNQTKKRRRGCCTGLMRGKPLDLVYEVK